MCVYAFLQYHGIKMGKYCVMKLSEPPVWYSFKNSQKVLTCVSFLVSDSIVLIQWKFKSYTRAKSAYLGVYE